MIAYNLLFSGVFLATAVAAIGTTDSNPNQLVDEGNAERTVGALRGNGKREADGKVDEVKHFMIACKSTENQDTCKNRILHAIPEEAQDLLRFAYYLKLPNVYAVEVLGDTTILDDVEGVVDDPLHAIQETEDATPVHRSLQYDVAPWGLDMIRAVEAWNLFQTQGEGVRVCVVDTGVDANHPDFDWNHISGYAGYDLAQPWYADDAGDDAGHGTHVAGTIAARHNGKGLVGVAPGADIYVARIAFDTPVTDSQILRAVEVCVNAGAKVINMSLGGTGYSVVADQLYKKVSELGVVVVAAAGNAGKYQHEYPCNYGSVICISAVDSLGYPYVHNTLTENADFAAPGVNVWSTIPGDFKELSGTSMAAPHVSGIIALMLSVNPSATWTQIYDALRYSAYNPLYPGGKDITLGYGIVDAVKAVQAISSYHPSSYLPFLEVP